MDFTLSKEHEMARTLFRDFAEKEVKPLAQEVDETEDFPQSEPLRRWRSWASLVFRFRRSTADRAAIL